MKEFKTRHKLIEVVECQALATFPFPLFDLQCSAGNQRKVTIYNCTLLQCQHTVCFGPFVAPFSLPVEVRGLGRPGAVRPIDSHTHARDCKHSCMRAEGWETSRVEKLAAAYDFHHKVSTAMLFEFGVDLRHILVRQLCHRFNLGQHGKKGAQRARAWIGETSAFRHAMARRRMQLTSVCPAGAVGAATRAAHNMTAGLRLPRPGRDSCARGGPRQQTQWAAGEPRGAPREQSSASSFPNA